MRAAVPLRLLLVLVALLSLNACSTRISLPDGAGLNTTQPSGWKARERQLLEFDHWQLMGKIAVRQGEQSQSAVINRWRQHENTYELRLSSAFLGMGSVELKGDRDHLLIRTADGEQYASTEPEDLITQVTGWRLPLSVLPYWVRGVPAPDQPVALGFGPEDRLRMLSQAGWDVYFERYGEATPGHPALPQLITATNGDARVRLAVSRWQAADKPATR